MLERKISASVGTKGGRNKPSDVITVQQMLNSVPPGKGRPLPELQVDGLCGFKTITAIQNFQSLHFGWQGRDGRVDPGGQTLRKLNDLATSSPFGPQPLTSSAVMLCPHGGSVSVQQANFGSPVLSANDVFIIGGCPKVQPGAAGGMPSPCLLVQWITSAGPALDTASIGLCLTASRVPQGSVIIVMP
jgi:hypothetical protein